MTSIYSNRRQPFAWATITRPISRLPTTVRLPTASRRLRGRDANLCRSRRHVMCRIRRRSAPDSLEYPKYALLSDCYRYIMRRGSGMPPSEALNRADEWSFSLCCVAIFSLGGLRDVRKLPPRRAGRAFLCDRVGAQFHAWRLVSLAIKI